MSQSKLEEGQSVVCINSACLRGNDVAPPLIVGENYTVKEIIFDKKGFPHIDVGLKSKHNFVRSYETGEELERGNKIHWCHPSRFASIKYFGKCSVCEAKLITEKENNLKMCDTCIDNGEGDVIPD